MSGSAVRLPPPELPEGPRSALVIATTTYADASLRALRAPATDAEELSRVLADPEVGGLAVTSVFDQTAHEIRLAIEEFLSGRAPEELIVMYVSCHGLTDLRRRLYFAATDTVKTRLGSTGVESTWVLALLEECRARSQVVILDCCFSGAFISGAKGEDDLGLNELTAPGRGRAVLTASNAREYSFVGSTGEDVHADAPAPGSVFTAALLAGLRDGAADRDGDGFVTVDEAYAYAYQQVRAAGIAQTPQRWLSGGEGQLLLARNPIGRAVVPRPLPDAVQAALDSPLPDVRVGAVRTLGAILAADDPGRALTAEQALRRVAAADVVTVAAAAREVLWRHERTRSPEPKPVLSAVPPAGNRGPKLVPIDPTPPAEAPPGPPPDAEPARNPDPPREPPPRRPGWLSAAVVAAALAAIAGIAIVVTPFGDDSASLPGGDPLRGNQLIVPIRAGSNADLYLGDVAGGQPLRLTSSPLSDSSASLSPDRATVVYRRYEGDKTDESVMRVMGSDGSGDRDLWPGPVGECPAGITRPGWDPVRPDQVAIACHTPTGKARFYLVGVDGRVRQEYTLPEDDVGDPAFSPDGRRLAFWAGDDLPRDGGRLYVMGVDGSGRQALTTSKSSRDADPTWSPDGRTIAFSRLQRGSRNRDIYRVGVDGEAQPERLTTDPANEDSPSFSPDGRSIAYLSKAPIPDLPDLARVWVMGADGQDPRPLWREGEPSRRTHGAPIWSRR